MVKSRHTTEHDALGAFAAAGGAKDEEGAKAVWKMRSSHGSERLACGANVTTPFGQKLALR
jgi:hypothetical protein